MQLHHNFNAVLWVEIPQFPGLFLASTTAGMYTQAQLQQLAANLTAATTAYQIGSERLTIQVSVRSALRLIYDPAALRRHPLTAYCTFLPLVQRGDHLAKLLRNLIDELESTGGADRRDLRGMVLRLRFIEALSRPEVCQLVGVSERQYFRLQTNAIDWLIVRLEEQPATMADLRQFLPR